MKNAYWILFVVSVLLFVLGVLARFPGPWNPFGQSPGTYWRGAMAMVIYAIALKVLGTNGQASVRVPSR